MTLAPPKPSIRDLRVVAAAGLLYVAVYIVFWPPTFTSLDESTYFNMAYTLRRGSIYPDVMGLAPVGTFPVGSHLVSKYPLGMSALLAATSLFGWPFALGTNLLVHVTTFALLAWLLRQHGIPPGFALLFLFHPTAVLYSRTVMADPFSGLILLLAFWALLRRQYLLSGGLLGFAVLVRTANAIALPLFALACVLEPRDGGRNPYRRVVDTTWLLLGTVPGASLAFYYATVIAAGQMISHTGSFAPAHFPEMFPAYVVSLLVIFPGMLLAPLFLRGRGRTVILTVTAGFVLLYSFWYWRDRGTSTVETLVVGQRYFLAVLPLLMFSYAVVVWRATRNWPERITRMAGSLVCLALFAGTVAVHTRHARYLVPLISVRRAVLETTSPADLVVSGTLVAKLLHPAWGVRPTCITGGAPEDVLGLRRCVEDAMARPNTRVFLANWVRPQREDDRLDAGVMDTVTHLFTTRPVALDGAVSLPAQFSLVEVIR